MTLFGGFSGRGYTGEGGKYTYAIVAEDGTGEDTTTLSFYRIAGDRYIGAAPRTQKGNAVPGQNIIMFHWDGTAFRTMAIKDERSEQLANHYGVAIQGFSYKIGGPIENQRAKPTCICPRSGS